MKPLPSCGACSSQQGCGQPASHPKVDESSKLSPSVQEGREPKRIDEKQAIHEAIAMLEAKIEAGVELHDYELHQLASIFSQDSYSSLTHLHEFYVRQGIKPLLKLVRFLHKFDIWGHYITWYLKYCREQLLLEDDELPYEPTDLNHMLSLTEYMNIQASIFKAFNPLYEFKTTQLT